MKRCYSLYPVAGVLFAFSLSGCNGGSDGGNAPPQPPTDPYVLDIAPASDQLTAVALDTPTGVDLSGFIKTQGLNHVQIKPALKVKKVLGAKPLAGEETDHQCHLAKGNDLSIDLEFSTPGACVFQYQVTGQTISGQTIEKEGEITIVGSQKPSMAILAPMSLLLIAPKSTEPYQIVLDAQPAPVLSKKIPAPETGRNLGNDQLGTGGYTFPKGFALSDATINQDGKGTVEANKNYDGVEALNTLTYTTADDQLGMSQISYLLEKEGGEGEVQLGQIHVSVGQSANHAPQAIDFCQLMAEGSDSVEVDLSPYVKDSDPDDHLRIKNLLTHTGTIQTDPNDPLKFQFTITDPTPAHHYISYLIEDGHGGLNSGQIKALHDDGLSRVTYTMSAGYGFGYRLDDEGHLWVTGANSDGNLGLGNSDNQNAWVPATTVQDQSFFAVSANQGDPIVSSGGIETEPARYGYLLDTEGKIWTTGDNAHGQLGFGGKSNASGNYEASSLWKNAAVCTSDERAVSCPEFTMVSAGTYHGYALDSSGQIWSVGHNEYSQLGRPGYRTLADPNWAVSLCSNAYGPASSDDGTTIACPKFVSVNAGPYHGYAIDEDGGLWVIGNNRNGQLGVGKRVEMGSNTGTSTGKNQYKWGKVEEVYNENFQLIPAPKFIQVDAGGGNTKNSFGYALDETGHLYATGNGSHGKLGSVQLDSNIRTNTWSKISLTRTLATGVKMPILFKEVRAGHEHVYALSKDCGIWAVGSNEHGQLATGSNVPSETNQWMLPKKTDRISFSGLSVTELTTGANMGYIKDHTGHWGAGAKQGLGFSLDSGTNSYYWQPMQNLPQSK